ncbi:uncharacterized protein LOC106166595 [Lingula anatina]|uniref:Uncharacterized protein LOC106166595 n=1 Tax=Lingula anatina TaxID=7574 RepID=A0A1S3IR79_LINAN|nr:uncharacterized protein LOC106166595 [Lingula anatina]|eukprot:XP_013400717.1 uncharacterized protein LOC106166595 [Lingula anatina]
MMADPVMTMMTRGSFPRLKQIWCKLVSMGHPPVEAPHPHPVLSSRVSGSKEQPFVMTAEADPRPAADYEQPWEYNKKKSLVFENMPANPDPVDGSLQHIDYTKKSNRISRQISASDTGKVPLQRGMSYDSGADIPPSPAPITVTDHRGQGVTTGASENYEEPWDLTTQQNIFENKLQNKHGRSNPLPRAASAEHDIPHAHNHHKQLKFQQSLPNYEDPWDLESRQKEFQSKLKIKEDKKDAAVSEKSHVYDLFEKQTNKEGKVTFSQQEPDIASSKPNEMSRKKHSQGSVKNRKSYKMATGDVPCDPEVFDQDTGNEDYNYSQEVNQEFQENSAREHLPIQRIQSIKNRDSYRQAVGDVDVVHEGKSAECGGNQPSGSLQLSGRRTPPQPARPPKPKASRESSPMPRKDDMVEPLEQNHLTDADTRPTEDYEDPWDIKAKQQGTAVSQLLAGSGKVAVVHPNVQKSNSTETLGERIDPDIPLVHQGWYHGSISRTEAENLLRVHKEGSFLVRMSESNKEDYSLSLRGKCGYMHMKITRKDGGYVLGQFSQPYETIPGMVNHYTLNKLTIKGAEHMCLLHPVAGDVL